MRPRATTVSEELSACSVQLPWNKQHPTPALCGPFPQLLLEVFQMPWLRRLTFTRCRVYFAALCSPYGSEIFLLLILSMKDWFLFFLASLSSWLCMSLPGSQSLKIQMLWKWTLFWIKKEQDYNATVAVYKTLIQVCFTCTKCAIHTASIFTAALSDPPWLKSQRKNPESKD